MTQGLQGRSPHAALVHDFTHRMDGWTRVVVVMVYQQQLHAAWEGQLPGAILLLPNRPLLCVVTSPPEALC
jgi:hypothetical protein